MGHSGAQLALELRVRLLEDKAAIGDTLHRFAAGLDTKDWELLSGTLADEVSVDMPGVAGGAQGDGPRPAADAVAAARAGLAGARATQHVFGNRRFLSVDVDAATGEGTARVAAALRADRWPAAGGGERHTLFGSCDARLLRSPAGGGWRLSSVRVRVVGGGAAAADRDAAPAGGPTQALPAPSPFQQQQQQQQEGEAPAPLLGDGEALIVAVTERVDFTDTDGDDAWLEMDGDTLVWAYVDEEGEEHVAHRGPVRVDRGTGALGFDDFSATPDADGRAALERRWVLRGGRAAGAARAARL